MGRVGCAIGAHTGPSIIGIVFPDAFDNRFLSLTLNSGMLRKKKQEWI